MTTDTPPLPGHPEPHTMQWTEQELETIRRYGAAVRAHALEQAAAAVEQHDRAGREWIRDSLWGALSGEAAGRIRALATP